MSLLLGPSLTAEPGLEPRSLGSKSLFFFLRKKKKLQREKAFPSDFLTLWRWCGPITASCSQQQEQQSGFKTIIFSSLQTKTPPRRSTFLKEHLFLLRTSHTCAEVSKPWSLLGNSSECSRPPGRPACLSPGVWTNWGSSVLS